MVKKIIIPAKLTKRNITSPLKKKVQIQETKKALTKTELEQALLNNFVNLQKVLTNLSVKFDLLSDNISKLLQLFEISAKSFAEKYSEKEKGEGEVKEDKQFLGKLDSLLDQNKTIAKGIMLMEEKIRQRASTQINRETEPEFKRMLRSKPLSRY